MSLNLNEEQRAAVEYLEGPLLVLAGPGTGKTQLLSAKVAYILEYTDANPENILCLTFTEAGAENMRDRLQTMMGQAANGVNIHTYHAFGRNLLERYQNYAENLDRRLDSPVDATMQYRIITKIQQNLPVGDILKKDNPKDIIETISNAKSERLSADDLRKIAEQNIADSQEISDTVSPLLEDLVPRSKFETAMETTYGPISDFLAGYVDQREICLGIERTGNILARELKSAIDEVLADEKQRIKPLSGWKNAFFEKTTLGGYRLKDHIANKKLLSLANVMEKYNQELDQRGWYDFDDMIEQTIHYLKTDRGFRLSLSELFQYILLDEFQDTNASQFELIKLLTDYEQPNVMAVGDDDQAIYEFQGANASNLMEFQEHYGAKVITLVKNYRSSGDVLGLSRQIADQIEDSFVHSYDNVDKNLIAMREFPEQTQLEISRHEFPCLEAEFYFIAKQIRELIDQGADPTEIAILAPKHKNLVTLLPFLRQFEIPVSYEKRENLLDDERMRELIQLAKFIDRLSRGEQPSEMLLEILSYDFWGLDTLKIMQMFPKRYQKAPVFEILKTGAKNYPELAEITNFLANLAQKALLSPLEVWLNYLIGELELGDFVSPYLGYYKKILSDAELVEFYEGLATFRQHVMTYARNIHPGEEKTPKLADFVIMIADYELAGTEIMRISNFRSADRAVQMMTAHKSKGLEFQYVFLISLDNNSWGKSKGNNNMLTLPKNLAKIRHTGITDDEKLRLLFVAMTRAKAVLVMTNSSANADGKTLARLDYLNESSREAEAPISPFLPEGEQTIRLHREELSEAEKVQTLATSWLAKYQHLTPEIEQLERERIEKYQLSATDLTSFIDLAYAGPQALYERLILHVPAPPATVEQIYGILIHSVFEDVTRRKLSDDDALAKFRAELANQDLEDEEKQQLLELGERNLRIALAEFGEILRHDNSRAEVNLSPERLVFDGVPLVGKIDHISIDDKAKTIEVYDFKTGKFRPETWTRFPSLYKMRLQLGFYKLLLNLSPTYRNYKVTTGHILFVTPDEDDMVHDKVYDYNAEDDEELKNLIRAVYREISSLNFAHNENLFLPADQNNSMKQIREFVEKIIKNEF